jgi:predicted regulator of Ras-like GTPase activity (Roadblock/LC7/MglB family)
MAFDANHGEAHLLLVESDGGYIVTARVGDSLCLVVTAKQEASLGLLLITVRKAAGEIPTDDV